MTFDTKLLLDILITAMVSQVISLQTVQTIKPLFPNSDWIKFVAVGVNMLVGMGLVLFFTDLGWQGGIFVGFFSWIGADLIYKKLESGLRMESFSEMQIPEEPQGTE